MPSDTRPPDTTLAPLVRRVQNGDLNAFTELVRRFQDMAVGYAFAVLGDFHRAEDAAQEAFVQVLDDLHALREPAAFAGWLRRIVFKHCGRHTRRARLSTVALEEHTVSHPTADALHGLERAEEHADVQRAIDALPPHQRQIVSLYYMGHHAQDEIAAFLGINPGTVRKRLHDARKNLKKAMLEMVGETLRQGAPSRGPQFAADVLRSALPLQVSIVLDKDRTRDLGTTAAGRGIQVPEGATWLVEPRLDLDEKGWDRLLGEMKERRIPGLRAGGRLSDRHLKRIGELGDFLLYLDLESTQAGISDAGLQYLAGLPHLRHLNLNLNAACNAPALLPAAISDNGLECLAVLTKLETLYLHNLFQVGDQSARHLKQMKNLRRFGCDATRIGDEGLKNLEGHEQLMDLSLSPLVSDKGLAFLRDLPAFTDGNNPQARLSLGKSPLVGDEGLRVIAELKGLHELGLCESRLMTNNWVKHMPAEITDRAAYSAAGLAHLPRLPGLQHLIVSGERLDDDALVEIGRLPALVDFGAGYAVSGTPGWSGLAQSQSLKRLAIFSSHGLDADGFKALSRLPKLEALSVGSENLPDEGLAPLAKFAALRHFGVGRGNVFSAAAFAHVAQIPQLESVSMSYVRTLGDEATRYLAQAPRLRTLSLTDWRMGNDSCAALAQAPALEELHLDLRRVTDAGLLHLNDCKQLKRLRLDRCPFVSEAGLAALRHGIELTYKPGTTWDYITSIVEDETMRPQAIEILKGMGSAARGDLETALEHVPEQFRPDIRGILDEIKTT